MADIIRGVLEAILALDQLLNLHIAFAEKLCGALLWLDSNLEPLALESRVLPLRYRYTLMETSYIVYIWKVSTSQVLEKFCRPFVLDSNLRPLWLLSHASYHYATAIP
ncbi:hypothetical protein EAI_08820 [Harpegnathos saltator]|uniref:Uncharacterized protein n=1 Tax=Harpegnathos saltator TaxID=610380 RepID=E2C042_HARSA|nr:hypothetical protein EAI_08820 [Harpegnathos saltator]